MRAAIYCRVSTDNQEKEGTSLDTQRERCLDYCQRKNYQVFRQFSESYSGLTLERPELIKLRNLIRASDIDIVVIYQLDRLSRNATHGVILRDELDKHQVALRSVTEDIDDSPLGKGITYLRDTFAQIEAEKIKERTIRGKQARLKEGRLPQGTGIGIFGYKWNKTTGKREIIDHEAEIVRKIFTLAFQRHTTNGIATELNKAEFKSKAGMKWHPMTIKRILNNESYFGNTYYGMSKRVGKTKVVAQPRENWTLLPDITPPIITEEMFKRAQEAINQGKLSRPVKQNSSYLLTGFIRCPNCGSTVGGTTLTDKKTNHTYRYYQCRGARPTAIRGKICHERYIKADELENAVLNKLTQMITSPLTQLSMATDMKRNQPDDIVPLLTKQIDQLRNKINAYPAREQNLYDLLAHDAVTKEYVLNTIKKLKQERLNDEKQKQALITQRSEATRAERITLKLSEVSETIKEGLSADSDFQQKRRLLNSVRLKVQADPKSHQFNITLGGQIISSTTVDEEEAPFNQALKEFEQQHPDITIEDLLDFKTQLPQDTPFARAVNQVHKNLVTIERTSGCMLNRDKKLNDRLNFF